MLQGTICYGDPALGMREVQEATRLSLEAWGKWKIRVAKDHLLHNAEYMQCPEQATNGDRRMWFPKDQVRSFLKGNSNVHKFTLGGHEQNWKFIVVMMVHNPVHILKPMKFNTFYKDEL